MKQKGPKLIEHALTYTLKKGGQFVLLGSQPTKNLAITFKSLQRKTSKNKNAHILLQHNDTLAYNIFAGSDFLIIPSLFEPCGITQMIAMHFGTIPIARQTGGLCDTIFDCETHSYDKATGILFEKSQKKAIEKAIDRAFALFDNRSSLQHLRQNGKTQNFDWDTPCKKYLSIYKKLLR